MNYTANYQFPQWVESDRLMMDDFNAAMSQIEQGLTGMEDRLPTVKLREFTITQAAASFPLDLSNLDLSPYAGLRFAAVSKESVNGWVGLQLNGLTAGYTYSTPSSLNPSTAAMAQFSDYGSFRSAIDLYPLGNQTLFLCEGVRDTGSRVDGIWIRGTLRELPYEEISSAAIVCREEGTTLAPGTKVVLYGLRA